MITRERVISIQEKIKKAIAEIEKSENVKIDFGTISLTPQRYSTSMSVTTLEKSEKVESIMERTCRSIGFTQNVIGMTFEYKGDEHVVTDIKTKNRKYPVIATWLALGDAARARSYYEQSIPILEEFKDEHDLI